MIRSDWTFGTITLTNGSAAFTGEGTLWLNAKLTEGDTIFDLPGTPYQGTILAITGQGTGTLTKPWDGPTITTAYRMRFQPDGSRVPAQAAQLIELLGNGNLLAFAGLAWSGGTQFPAFNGAGAMVLVPKSDLSNGVFYNIQVPNLAARAAYDSMPGPTETAPGYAVFVADVGDGRAAIYSKQSDTAGDWSAPAYITAKPRVDFVIDDPGRPAEAEVLLTVVIPINVEFAVNMGGSYAEVNGENATAPATYRFTKNGTEFGTLTFSPTGTYDFAGVLTQFTPGDILRVIAPSPRDATLSAVTMTLSATR